MNNQAATYAFYLCLLAMAGVGEYFHLLPMGAATTVLGGILGHQIGEISHQTGAQNNATTNH